jgi:hypothetical protein
VRRGQDKKLKTDEQAAGCVFAAPTHPANDAAFVFGGSALTKKRSCLLSGGIFVACCCIALAVLASLPPCPGITKANFDRIQMGMALSKVEEVFGQPAQGVNYFFMSDARIWSGDDGYADVSFTLGKVSEKSWHDSDDSVFERFRRRYLGWSI